MFFAGQNFGELQILFLEMTLDSVIAGSKLILLTVWL